MKTSTKINLIGVVAALTLAPVVGLLTGTICAALFAQNLEGSQLAKSGELVGLAMLGAGGIAAILAGIATLIAVLLTFRGLGRRIAASGEDTPVGPIVLKTAGAILAAFLLLKVGGVLQERWTHRPQELTNQQVVEALGQGSKTWGQEKRLGAAEVPALVAVLEKLRRDEQRASAAPEKLIKVLLEIDDPRSDAELDLWTPLITEANLRSQIATRLLSRSGPAPRHAVLFRILKTPAQSYDTLAAEREELSALAATKPSWLEGLDPKDHGSPRDLDLFLALCGSYEEDPTGVIWEHLKQLPESDAPVALEKNCYGYGLLSAAYERSPEQFELALQTYLSRDLNQRHLAACEFVFALQDPSPALRAQLSPYVLDWLRIIAPTLQRKFEYMEEIPGGGARRLKGALRVCDRAAMILTKWDPKTYVFEPKVSEAKRNEQIGVIEKTLVGVLESSGD